MLSADAKSSIARIWNVFWSNGMTNPLVVIEQITFLIFMKLLDDNQIMQERSLLFYDIGDMSMTIHSEPVVINWRRKRGTPFLIHETFSNTFKC